MEFIIFIIVIVILYNLFSSSSSSGSSSSNNNRPYNHNDNVNKLPHSSLNRPIQKPTVKNDYSIKNEQTSQKVIFVPNTKINFMNSNEFGDYNWYSIYNYYPVNRFSQNELSQIDINARRHVFNFKDGISPKLYAELFASAMINKYGTEFLKNKILLIIPASNKTKTINRFSEFCKVLSELTGMINGFNFLTNNENERTPAHNSGSRHYDVKAFLKLNYDISNKDVFVLDDVRTSGASSNGVFKFLKENNAKSVTFIYLAKTVSINN